MKEQINSIRVLHAQEVKKGLLHRVRFHRTSTCMSILHSFVLNLSIDSDFTQKEDNELVITSSFVLYCFSVLKSSPFLEHKDSFTQR